jgi:hypothetical protein
VSETSAEFNILTPHSFQKGFDRLLNTIALNFRILILVSALLIMHEGSVDGIPVVASISAPVQTGPGIHTACLFPRIKRSQCGSNHPHHLAPKLNIVYSCTIIPLWAFMAFLGSIFEQNGNIQQIRIFLFNACRLPSDVYILWAKSIDVVCIKYTDVFRP